jgi:hypothetical protein|tara:strand:+ start:21 stop:218 length:198 start_codon:yes stop_codon:yes gene_type:complete
MREVISLHIGQAGIQTGNSCWELFCLGASFRLEIFEFLLVQSAVRGGGMGGICDRLSSIADALNF